MNFISRHKEGLILTLIFHLLLLFIIISNEFFTPLPLPEEKGILLDFGATPDAGMGLIEPSPKESAPARPVRKEPVIPKPKSPVAQKQPEVKERILTQDYEKTAAIDEAKQKIDDQKRKERLEKQLSDNRKRDSLQKINEERIAELNRLAEIRRQDSIKEAAKQASINQMNSRAKNAFGGVSGQGTDQNSTGQGTAYKPGNQGSPDGVAGGGIGDGSGSGTGSGRGNGTGVSFSLKGRVAKSLLKPSYPGNEDGIVVVEITVDKTGKVTKAVPGVKGTNTLNSALLEAARKAALSTKFNENNDAPEIQTGTITYHFVLN